MTGCKALGSGGSITLGKYLELSTFYYILFVDGFVTGEQPCCSKFG